MGLYSGYAGKGLNHVELLYQRGERELAMAFTRLLGCTPIPTPQVNETGSTYICVHPDDDDRDGMNNVLYLSEIRAPQHDLGAFDLLAQGVEIGTRANLVEETLEAFPVEAGEDDSRQATHRASLASAPAGVKPRGQSMRRRRTSPANDAAIRVVAAMVADRKVKSGLFDRADPPLRAPQPRVRSQ